MTDEPKNPIDESIPPPGFMKETTTTTRTPRRQRSSNSLRPPFSYSDMPIPHALEGGTWAKRWWRPAMAWQYLFICLFDFAIGPIASMIFFKDNPEHFVQWTSLTLQYGGVYHMSMGVIIGVTAYSRGQEKLKGIEK